MALISAFNVIRGLASFHLLLAFFFLTAPQKIAEQNVVFLLGESMRIVRLHHDSHALCSCANARYPSLMYLASRNLLP